MFPLQNLQQSYRNKDCVVLTGSTGRHKDQWNRIDSPDKNYIDRGSNSLFKQGIL